MTGKVLILSEPTEASHIPPDTILVTSTTDPSWTPLFMHIAGENKRLKCGSNVKRRCDRVWRTFVACCDYCKRVWNPCCFGALWRYFKVAKWTNCTCGWFQRACKIDLNKLLIIMN